MKHCLFASLFMVFCLPAAASGAAEDHRLRELGFIVQEGFLEAPAFTTRDAAGNPVDSTSFRGRLVVLNFWATWCPPCRLEMPAMERLYREFRGKGLEVVAVNFMESAERVRAFAEEQNLTYPMLLDGRADIAERYGVRRLPVTMLIGREGELLARSVGYKEWYKDDMRALVAALLGEGQVAQAATGRNGAPSLPGPAVLAVLAAVAGFAVWCIRRSRARRTEPLRGDGAC